MKNNKRINIVEKLDDAEDIKMNYVKNELKKVFKKYMKKHCDEEGNQLENNLTMRQTTGIKDLKTKMKAEDLVCIETDKTGKFALDTKENYMKKIQKHISKYKLLHQD